MSRAGRVVSRATCPSTRASPKRSPRSRSASASATPSVKRQTTPSRGCQRSTPSWPRGAAAPSGGRDGADEQAGAVLGEGEQVVKVPARRLGLAAAGGDVHAGRDDEGRGEQLQLQVVRQLQLAPYALLAQVLGDQGRVLDRGADLI